MLIQIYCCTVPEPFNRVGTFACGSWSSSGQNHCMHALAFAPSLCSAEAFAACFVAGTHFQFLPCRVGMAERAAAWAAPLSSATPKPGRQGHIHVLLNVTRHGRRSWAADGRHECTQRRRPIGREERAPNLTVRRAATPTISEHKCRAQNAMLQAMPTITAAA